MFNNSFDDDVRENTQINFEQQQKKKKKNANWLQGCCRVYCTMYILYTTWRIHTFNRGFSNQKLTGDDDNQVSLIMIMIMHSNVTIITIKGTFIIVIMSLVPFIRLCNVNPLVRKFLHVTKILYITLYRYNMSGIRGIYT